MSEFTKPNQPSVQPQEPDNATADSQAATAQRAILDQRFKAFLGEMQNAKSIRPLQNGLENARRHPNLSDQQKNLAESIIKARMFTIDPRAAAQQYPRPIEQANEMLEKTWAEVVATFDLSNNQHGKRGNIVRAGGDMTTGQVYLDMYISYRNPNGWVAGLAWLQEKGDTVLFLRVSTYWKGRGTNPETHESWDFSVDQQDEAKAKFFALLEDEDRCAAKRRIFSL